MYKVLILIYIIVSLLTLLYTEKNLFPKEVYYIVILSGFLKSITLRRINISKNLVNMYPLAKIIACGKFKANLFRTQLTSFKDKLIIQDKSTNTYEDAKFRKDIIGDTKSLILVTSHSHQVRSLHTFEKFFNKESIFSYPTNDTFTLYSPVLPSGWIAALVNYIKDKKIKVRMFLLSQIFFGKL